jgi:hypothetical protein
VLPTIGFLTGPRLGRPITTSSGPRWSIASSIFVRRLPWALMLHDLEGNVLGVQACAQLAGVHAMHEPGIDRCVIPACVQDKQR